MELITTIGNNAAWKPAYFRRIAVSWKQFRFFLILLQILQRK
jgi:hypothetical protein